jgi:hypothetical protein
MNRAVTRPFQRLAVTVGTCVGLPAFAAAAAPPDAGVRSPPAPGVKLALTAPTTRGTWKLRVTNDGDVPVRIAADARTLTLDLTPRGTRTPVRCELPDDMRPEGGDLERPLVLPPGKSYSESFEARLYCFGETKGGALDPGAIVVARLGWAGKHPRSFEVLPIEGVEPRVAPVGALEAPPVVLPDEPTAMALTPAGGRGDADTATAATDAPKMSATSGRWVDVDSFSGLEVPVTLRNDGAHAVVVAFRPEVLRFDVVGPDGADSCTWPVQPGAPTREKFSPLAPGGSTTVVATLPSYCDEHTFDRPGAYFVRARIDTSNTGGSTIGVKAFEGLVVAADPTVVRLHKGRAAPVLVRPKLDEP